MGKLLGFLSALLPTLALAHVTIDPKAAPAGDYAKLVLRVPHGCDGSPTAKITVQLPDGVVSVKPQVHAGWEIATKTRKLAKPISLHGKEISETTSEISWSGGPLPDEYMDEFGMSLKLPEKAPGKGESKLVFPVLQECRKGSARWEPALDLTSNPAAGAGHSH